MKILITGRHGHDKLIQNGGTGRGGHCPFIKEFSVVWGGQIRALPIKKNSGPIMPMPLIKIRGYPASRNGQGSLCTSTYFNIG